jgi:ribosomal protein S15P/S13E
MTTEEIKPEMKEKWIKLKPEEIEKKVVKLAKEGMPTEKIGLELRDKHGIPKVKIYGKRIKQILKENNIYKDSEYNNIQNKFENLKKHLAKNKHDYSAKRSLITKTGRINKLKKVLQN